MDAQIVYEKNLLKRLFSLDGEFHSSSLEDITYEVNGKLFAIRFKGSSAKLYENYRRGEWENTDTKILSAEDFAQLQAYGYEVS